MYFIKLKLFNLIFCWALIIFKFSNFGLEIFFECFFKKYLLICFLKFVLERFYWLFHFLESLTVLNIKVANFSLLFDKFKLIILNFNLQITYNLALRFIQCFKSHSFNFVLWKLEIWLFDLSLINLNTTTYLLTDLSYLLNIVL